jgi:polyphosphate glucokinase
MPNKNSEPSLRILSIDIGGSRIKATILNNKGKLLQEYTKLKTPKPASPANIIKTILELTSQFETFERVSVGFPGYVRDGIVWTAPNLGTELWAGINFRKMLQKALNKPAQVINDADLQGLGIVKGKGLEMLITLGTGMGTALLLNGQLLPHLELAHHPITGKKDYDQYIGDIVLKKISMEEWNERMKKVLAVLKTVVNYDTLYIGGGNAVYLTIPLDENMKIVSNKDGIKGGARLWAPFNANNNLHNQLPV